MKQGRSLLLFQLLSVCLALQSVPSTPTGYDELYADGVSSYSDESWGNTVASFRQAVQRYSREVTAREQCYAECKGQPASVPQDYADSEELRFLHVALQRTTCVDRCKERIAGHQSRGGVSSKVEKNMASRKPYSYLQLALYKVERQCTLIFVLLVILFIVCVYCEGR